MSDSCCGCQEAPKLIFPCSGAADVGEIADRAARKLTKDGVGSMYCLAGIGGEVSGIVESTKTACGILVIDGCPLACARKTVEKAGFREFEYIQVTSMGMEKGKSPAEESNVLKVYKKGEELLNAMEVRR